MLAGGALAALTDTPLCPTAFLFGFPCPGCGLTRATVALLHGNLAQALHFHPLVFVLAPLFAFALGKALFDYVRGPQVEPSRSVVLAWWTGRPGIALAGVFLVLVVGVWALRFAGYFGGPVPVVSYREWRAHHGPPSLGPGAPLTR